MKKLDQEIKNSFLEYYNKNRHLYSSNSKCIFAFLAFKNLAYGKDVFEKILREVTIDHNAIENELNANDGDGLQDNIVETVENKEVKTVRAKTQKSITSLQDALTYFEVDTDLWEVVTWKCKSWDTSMKVDEIVDGKVITKPVKRTNYLVTINLKKKCEDVNYNKVKEVLSEFIIHKRPKTIKGNRTGVLTLADIHTGLDTKKLTEFTQEFNLKKLLQYLDEASYIINSFKYDSVYLNILGDIVESVTGYNKIETLKEMEQGMQGGNIIIAAYEILHKFALSINNLKEINMISGNHDRLTPDKAMDKDGGAAQLVAYMLNSSVTTNWHPFILKRVIDDVCYLLTHGDHKFVKQDIGKVIFEYGDQKLYNVLLSGHWHTRKSTKIFQEKNTIMVDTNKYRAITVAPIVTGNRWTEENGWSSSPGITITEAAKDKKNINVYDIALSR
jgi:hypothetical protein